MDTASPAVGGTAMSLRALLGAVNESQSLPEKPQAESVLLEDAAQFLPSGHSGKSPSKRSYSSADALSLEANASSDRTVQEYLYFLASIEEQKKPVSERADSFNQRVNDLVRDLVAPLGLSVDDVESLELSASMSLSSSVAISAQRDASGFRLSASAEASVQAEFMMDVKTRDGQTISIRGSVSISVSASIEIQTQGQQADPLAIDLDGDGEIALSGVEQGLNFDINADGVRERTSFVKGSDGFIAYDRNGNGVIDDGSELFGDQHGEANGFLELANFDDNQDGFIDKGDEIFEKLLVMQRGFDGTLKLSTLKDHGVESLGLGYENTNETLESGDTVAQVGAYKRDDGSVGYLADVLLRYR